ncbi:XdhC family protein [Halalkalibacter nanhaiisediminis]|uniref:Xanthine/CO dehydrogenase XdhC/CoxF family maturation factor n=1 Tax=Halalkalibacter nanhaiisediminis TaxID=688079 RepID=A0A562QN19_9BACI|nr:XdhC/CoxI family protein [Halalkalibacter nanhaiisediminis]TWI58152.1 xanthine/CO dehydrogenase XdhC/CoxF family maturation factor [Halalkalibacter nanhaiisediminis]
MNIAISKEIDRCKQLGLRGVLATIISVEGSTYQKAGTKCFLAEDGKLTGLLSGGCVENDIIEHGKQIIDSGETKCLQYDLRDNGDEVWGLGVGCNGSMEIFLEPYHSSGHDPNSKVIEKMYAVTTPHVVSTIVDAKDSTLIGEKWIVSLKNFKEEKVSSLFSKKNLQGEEGKKLGLVSDENMKLFIEEVAPPPALIIFGAGPDAVPLVQAVKQIGWHVTVIDHRPGFVTKENFPLADQLICSPPGTMANVVLNENTFTVIMSHHFSQDQMVLKHLLKTNVPYIGLLGPKRRAVQLLESILTMKSVQQLRMDRIHSPIGLNIGAKTPEEIAFSIVSELIAVYRHASAAHLKDTEKGLRLKGERDLLYQM